MLKNSLNSIASFPQLSAYLLDELGWPFDERATFDDHTFEYEPSELGLSGKAVAGVEIRSLRPMAINQPWGIVCLKFQKRDLGIAALRKVLRAFVRKKRDSATASDRPTWQLEHLLFVCVHKTEGDDAVTFVHFEQPTGPGTAKLAAFGWSGHSRNRTVLQYNLERLKWPDDPKDTAAWLQKWQSAFDVEAVTDRFFKDYQLVFQAVEAKATAVPVGEKRRLYTQRLFNRLLFLYFIQKKGWLEYNGSKDYLRSLFIAAEANKEDFLNERLWYAFFCGLNTMSEQESVHSMEELKAIRGTVPFLNGGLFDLEDAFDKHDAVEIPNSSFAEIFDLFERYNFTVAESTPLDVEVAVDPEMLGKVFEELVTGRHESGSYYTPRAIVSFMCREALKHYLRKVQDDETALAQFIDEGDTSGLKNPAAILKALEEVTVCDPACGSGAYLLGMMHELIRLREILFAKHKSDPKTLYQIKLEIIQKNLHGVDKDDFAVNIAKLRLWLSLAVDFGGAKPEPLPNLDFKIECGDSLLAPDPMQKQDFMGNLFAEKADEIAALKALYLTQPGSTKKATYNAIKKIEAELTNDKRPPAEKIIDWRIAFAEVFNAGGFDIVLGNPPYVRQEQLKGYKEKLKPYYTCYTGTADLFVYFYERGIQLLKPGGQFAFITSNKWFRSGYGEKLRTYLAAKTVLHRLIDFGDAAVFKAIAYPTIILLERTPPTLSFGTRSASEVDSILPALRNDLFASGLPR